MDIPLARPEIDGADIAAVRAVLQDPEGRLAMGPRLEAFERELATATDREFAIAMSSGTSALHLILEGLGIGQGDEVITTPFSFIASSNCILFVRATPVFVDIEPETLCIDPERIEAAITPRTKAILAVDVFGHPADWLALERIADRHGLALIDDSAEALGSALNGRRCGSFGRAGVFGFYPNKQITTGEGGAVVTDDPHLAELCRSMSNQGRGDGSDWLSHVRLGYNYRLDEMSAALGLSQLRRLDAIVEDRARVAGRYADALAGTDGIVLPAVADGVRMSWFVYVVRLATEFSEADRDAILERLSERGIGCRNYFAPIHLQPFYRQQLGTKDGDFPIAESVGARTIALPFYNELREDQIEYVAGALKEEMERLR
jgi:perosamine synthetase